MTDRTDPTPARETELKPCPWCAGVGEMYSDQDDGSGVYCVQCSACKAYPGKFYSTKSEAIAAWNRRPPAPAVGELVEALRSIAEFEAPAGGGYDMMAIARAALPEEP